MDLPGPTGLKAFIHSFNNRTRTKYLYPIYLASLTSLPFRDTATSLSASHSVSLSIVFRTTESGLWKIADIGDLGRGKARVAHVSMNL